MNEVLKGSTSMFLGGDGSFLQLILLSRPVRHIQPPIQLEQSSCFSRTKAEQHWLLFVELSGGTNTSLCSSHVAVVKDPCSSRQVYYNRVLNFPHHQTLKVDSTSGEPPIAECNHALSIAPSDWSGGCEHTSVSSVCIGPLVQVQSKACDALDAH
jgi:hypothetical protein